MFNFARFMRVTHSYSPWSASFATACVPNPALNLAPFGRWTALKRRRLALRWVAIKPAAFSTNRRNDHV